MCCIYFLFIFWLFVEMASSNTTVTDSITSTTASPTTTTTTATTTVQTTTNNNESTTSGKAFSFLCGVKLAPLITTQPLQVKPSLLFVVSICFCNDVNMKFLLHQCYVYGSLFFKINFLDI